MRVKGAFVATGPARATHGFYRVDELDITAYLTRVDNVIVVEVLGYNINTFDTLEQPSFLTEEFVPLLISILIFTRNKAFIRQNPMVPNRIHLGNTCRRHASNKEKIYYP